MEIFELASELGKKLKDDARLVAFEQAKQAYAEDLDLKKYTVEYEVQQRAMQNEMAKPDRDMLLIDTIQRRVDELYRLISENPAYIELNRAQSDVNELMNAVNQTIMSQITGEESSGCTHNCASCKGCH